MGVAIGKLFGVWGTVMTISVACEKPPADKVGPALVKFCHQFHRSGASIDLSLEFGQPTQVRVTTATDSCTPVLGQPCTEVPKGIVPVRLLEGDKVLMSTRVPIVAGSYIMYPVLSDRGVIAMRREPFQNCSTDEPSLLSNRMAPDAGPEGGAAPDGPASDAAGVSSDGSAAPESMQTGQ